MENAEEVSFRSLKVAQKELYLGHAKKSREVGWVTLEAVFVKFKSLSKFLLNVSDLAQDEIKVASQEADITAEASEVASFLVVFLESLDSKIAQVTGDVVLFLEEVVLR